MAYIIKAVFAVFWLVATGFLVLLAYIVLQTEANPKILWSWLVMCGFSFISASGLAYNIIFGGREHSEIPHHHAHLNKAGN